jgi:hypothetical protein
MGGGVEIGQPCGAPARRITVARIATACRVLGIEDEFDGKSIRLSAAGRTHPLRRTGVPCFFPVSGTAAGCSHLSDFLAPIRRGTLAS